MPYTKKDLAILRELAKETAETAALPIQEETRALWRRLNALRPARPMIIIDQLPWHELESAGGLRLLCEGEECRNYERRLRRQLYKWRNMRDDMVIEPFITVPMAIGGINFGPPCTEETIGTDPRNPVRAHHFIDQFQMEEDLEKLVPPVVTHDEAETDRRLGEAEEIFGGILGVKPEGWFPANHAWDRISTWRGVEPALYDLADRPEFMHTLVKRIQDSYLSVLDQCEEKGLLNSFQQYVHCTGAYSEELYGEGFDPEKPKAKYLWTFGLAQMLAAVSPAMFEEFEIDYIKPWCERFALVYYGCCDPLDGKLDEVRRIPNLRKISMSPWVDVERGAEGIGGDYVFSRKPNPAFLATDSFDEAHVEKDLRETFEACRRHSCPLEFILKDVSTIRYEPQRLSKWVEAARRVAQG